MERVANRLPLWKFLRISGTTRNEDLARDLDKLTESPDYQLSDWAIKFIEWEKSIR